jgi:hypothetical protein
MTAINTTHASRKTREEIAFWALVDTATPQELITFFSAPAESDSIANLSLEYFMNIYDHKPAGFIEEYAHIALGNPRGDAFFSVFAIVANAKNVPSFAGNALEALLALPEDRGEDFLDAVTLELTQDMMDDIDERIDQLCERYRDFPVIDQVVTRYRLEMDIMSAQYR